MGGGAGPNWEDKQLSLRGGLLGRAGGRGTAKGAGPGSRAGRGGRASLTSRPPQLRYAALRDPQGNLFYWKLLDVRLGLFVAFEVGSAICVWDRLGFKFKRRRRPAVNGGGYAVE